MSFDINGPNFDQPMVQKAQNMQNNGGGGNLGYFEREQDEEEILKRKKEEGDGFFKSEDDENPEIYEKESGIESLFDKVVKFFKKLFNKIKQGFKNQDENFFEA